MASYTTPADVLGELPGTSEAALGAKLAKAIADRSAFVRSALSAWPDACFPEAPNADPIVEQATRYLAAYDCAVFLKMTQRGDFENISAALLELGNGLLNDLRSGRLRMTIAAAAGVVPSPAVSAKAPSEATFTMANQDLWSTSPDTWSGL